MARKKNVRVYKYKCSISGEPFKLTSQAKNPDELFLANHGKGSRKEISAKKEKKSLKNFGVID